MASRLITECDVASGRVEDPLIVDADTVITPSALDAAYARGLRVVFARDRKGGRMPPVMRPFEELRNVSSANVPASAHPVADSPAPKSCGCACSCGTKSGHAPSPASASEVSKPAVARDWVDVMQEQRRRGFDASAFRK